MAGGSIDQISSALGALQSDNEEGKRQREAMFKKLDKISELLIGNNAITSQLAKDIIEVGVRHAKEISDVKAKLAQDVEAIHFAISTEVMPTVEDFKKLKQRGIGIVAGIGFLGGGSIVGLWELIKAYIKSKGTDLG